MLTSFLVRNFRTFKELAIQRLGRVNLIVGKNAVGKTSLLEAIWLYAARMRPEAIHEVLLAREEYSSELDEEGREVDVDVDSLFYGRPAGMRSPNAIVTGSSHSIVIGPIENEAERIRLELSPITVERPPSGKPPAGSKQLDVPGPGRGGTWVESILTVDQHGSRQPYNPLGSYFSTNFRKSRARSLEAFPPFLRAWNVDPALLGRWWDGVSLREPEDRIVAAMNLLAPVERITLKGNPRIPGDRVFAVRLKGQKSPQPLKTLGDGVERMFYALLALEYARESFESAATGASRSTKNVQSPRNNVLIVDEIESGIHHSVLADYWKMIFSLARELDVQVFATTHSWDCLRGFTDAVAEREDNDGLMIRLEKVEGEEQTGAVIADRTDLPIIIRDSIEVR
jgi:hypothetical protein